MSNFNINVIVIDNRSKKVLTIFAVHSKEFLMRCFNLIFKNNLGGLFFRHLSQSHMMYD